MVYEEEGEGQGEGEGKQEKGCEQKTMVRKKRVGRVRRMV